MSVSHKKTSEEEEWFCATGVTGEINRTHFALISPLHNCKNIWNMFFESVWCVVIPNKLMEAFIRLGYMGSQRLQKDLIDDFSHHLLVSMEGEKP